MIKVNTYPLARGLASYVLPRRIFERPGSGGTFSSEYCYSVWHRHLYFLLENGLFSGPQEICTVAEIGPGDSLGIGMSALYSGAEKYFAFDVIEHANLDRNLSVNDTLLKLYSENRDIPHGERQKNTHPMLPVYDFPQDCAKLSSEYFRNRHRQISLALRRDASSTLSMEYVVPWMQQSDARSQQLDLIFSQAVMEHVADIEFAYAEMYRWLRPGGVVSHQIDFKTHEMTVDWNGHWYIPTPVWRVLAHGRKYPLNRLPLSAHLGVLEKVGFKIAFVLPVRKASVFGDIKPAVLGVHFTADDLVTSGALIQAIK